MTNPAPPPVPTPESIQANKDLTSSYDDLNSSLRKTPGLLDNIAKGTNVTSSMFASLKNIIGDVSIELINMPGKLEHELQQTRPEIDAFRRSIGGISEEAVRTGVGLSGIGKAALDGYEEVVRAAISSNDAAYDSGIKLSNGLHEGIDGFDMLWDSASEAGLAYQKVIEGVANTVPTLIEKISKGDRVKLTAFKKILDLSGYEMADLLKRQYAFTGEAGTKIFEDISAVSVQLAKDTGLHQAGLQADILKVMEDVDNFGDIGVDAAGRIAASLGKLGLDFATFGSLTDGFMDFDSSAQKMGDLSALFGIQMDAMEMTYLANEDREEFLYRMREEILDAGLDVENMSNAKQRALASQLAMSVTQMRLFVDEGISPLDQGELVESTDKAAAVDGTTAAFDSIAVLTNKNTDLASTMTEELRLQQAYGEGYRTSVMNARIELRDTVAILKQVSLAQAQVNATAAGLDIITENVTTNIQGAAKGLVTASDSVTGFMGSSIDSVFTSISSPKAAVNKSASPAVSKAQKPSGIDGEFIGASGFNMFDAINELDYAAGEDKLSEAKLQDLLAELVKAQTAHGKNLEKFVVERKGDQIAVKVVLNDEAVKNLITKDPEIVKVKLR